MTKKDNFIFRNLCLKSYKRDNNPIFVDEIIEVKLLTHKTKNNFTLEINNLGPHSLKLKSFSRHDQFKILGDKNRYIQPKMIVQYRLQTYVKDLNLRYPIISLLIHEENKYKNSIK